MSADEKKIDESWKEQAEQERQGLRSLESKSPQDKPAAPSPGPAQPRRAGPSQGSARQEMPAGDFSMFLSSLSMQAMMALGEAAHPGTGLAQEDLEQARYLIDVLGLLQEKTQGNLSQEESALLDGLLYELRMKYVEKTQGRPA